MATTGKFNGDSVLIYVGGTSGVASSGDPIAHSIDATLSVSQDLPDATTKDSSQWVEHIKGNKSWEISGSGLVAYDSSFNLEYVMEQLINAATVFVRFGSNEAGDTEWTGNVSVSSSSFSAPQNSAAGYDFTFTGNGALTQVIIT